MSRGFGETSYDSEKCLEGLVKLVMTSNRLVMTSCRLGEMSGETSYDQLLTWRNICRV